MTLRIVGPRETSLTLLVGTTLARGSGAAMPVVGSLAAGVLPSSGSPG